MKTKITFENLLAQIARLQNGSVHLQRRKCGKSNCKCARGERHESLFLFTRPNRKLLKIYIPKSQVEEVSAAVKKAAETRKRQREERREAMRIFREENAYLRQVVRENREFWRWVDNVGL